MQEFDPVSGYRVLVRTVSGLAAVVCIGALALVYTRGSISGFYFPGNDDQNDGQMMIILLLATFHFLVSAVAGRFAWFAMSCRPVVDLLYLLSFVIVLFVIYFIVW